MVMKKDTEDDDCGPKLGNTRLLPDRPKGDNGFSEAIVLSRFNPLEDPFPFQHRTSLCHRPLEDLSTAHAILDLSSPHRIAPTSTRNGSTSSHSDPEAPEQSSPNPLKLEDNKTIVYTYDEFFVSDGRSKRRNSSDTEVPNSRGKYHCPECGKHYATSSNLSRHKQTHRTLESGSARHCPTCGKGYVSMPALAMHVLTHKLAHKCHICGKAFSRPWLLQGHLRSHTGERPYGCAHCGKAFADRSNLRAHMQTHSAMKSFKCRRCHKGFALKAYLNKHLESACFKEGSLTPESTTSESDNGSSVSASSHGPLLYESFSPGLSLTAVECK
ncbi:unnamed protein product [Cyprideis torosa]|uniref:Uncharacterized protein n=1 Tax=Cyprideis torosa TaxID=163714 RepID=A0A7R8W2H3_9CRUS|nr:unnamed protein product [Cyprideis torosa]CAG0881010.1 unnamed protein product [Cyprideis torosa]